MFWLTNKTVITRQYDTKGNYACVAYTLVFCNTQVEIATEIIPKPYKV